MATQLDTTEDEGIAGTALVRMNAVEKDILNRFREKHRSAKSAASAFVELLYQWDDIQKGGSNKDARLARIESATENNGKKLEELLIAALEKIDRLEMQLSNLTNQVNLLSIQNADLIRRMGRAEDFMVR